MKLPFLLRNRHRRTRGQAMVEFAMLLPVLALLMVMSLDLGRVFFGWVGLQNVSRIGANYAAIHPDAWDPTIPDFTNRQNLLDNYAKAIAREAAGLNCSPLPVSSPVATYIPTPSFDDLNGNGRYDLGEQVSVTLGCSFELITPLANSAVGGGVNLDANSVFPVRTGPIAGIPTPSASASASASGSASGSASASASASASGCPLPIANFTANPTQGKKPKTIQFSDATQTFGCAVTGWEWSFGDGGTSTQQNPSHTYTRNGLFSVTLIVTDPGGIDSQFTPGYIHICGNC